MKYFSLFFLPYFLFAQINYSGKVSPTYLMRISDGSDISLPFRLADVQIGYSFGDFEIKTNTALETRWRGTEAEFDLREAYLTWYPNFGEVKLGKMIHTWGAADGNNPTDNINPYNFYYMFLTGADRKIGVISASTKVYWKNFNLEGIFVPEHTANRLPFDEEDFPIQFPFEPDEYVDIDDPYEIGTRIQGTFNGGDISISYINGYDRGFSIQSLTPTGLSMNPFVPQFGYRKTDMYGIDFVSFIDDITVRGELGYFTSKDDVNGKSEHMLFNVTADYFQYVLQVEYSGFSDFDLGAQYLGTYIKNVEGETFSPNGIVPLTKVIFSPGMGTPFVMIAEKALIVNGSTSILDGRLDVKAMGLINLDETGYLFGVNADYSPFENWKFKIGLNKFMGDSDDPLNKFSQMEDFSHISLGLEFNF